MASHRHTNNSPIQIEQMTTEELYRLFGQLSLEKRRTITAEQRRILKEQSAILDEIHRRQPARTEDCPF
jgi:hypothetical protein